MKTLAKDIMSVDILTVRDDRDLNFTEVLLEAKNIRHIPVVDKQQRLVGLVSMRDICRYLSTGNASQFIPIREIMSTRVITAEPDTGIAELARMMLTNNISAIPIVIDGKILGMVSEKDFLTLVSELE